MPADLDPGAARDAADGYLVTLAQRGYLDAYEELARRYRDRVYRVALRMLGHPADAEDVTQDVLVTAWQRLSGFRAEAGYGTWLYRITVTRCLNHRRAARPTVSLEAAPEPAVPGVEEIAGQRLRLAAVAQAIAGLPVDQRAVLVLVQFEGLSYREVATILQVSEAAVRGRLERARRSVLASAREWL